MRIRRAATSDSDAIIAMQTEAWANDYRDLMPEGYSAVALQRETDPAVIDRKMASYPFYFVAEVSGQACGCITGGWMPDGAAEIWWLHVLNRYRRGGVGRRLVEYFVAQLPPTTPALFVTTFQGYAPTLAFYARLGFGQPTLSVAVYDGFAVNDVRLRRGLTSRDV